MSWFLSCKPAAIRATGLLPPCRKISDNVFINSGRFETAACSKNEEACSNSALSEIQKIQCVKRKTFSDRYKVMV